MQMDGQEEGRGKAKIAHTKNAEGNAESLVLLLEEEDESHKKQNISNRVGSSNYNNRSIMHNNDESKNEIYKKGAEEKMEEMELCEEYTKQVMKFSFNRLIKEPRMLDMEKEKLSSEMEKLANDNYTAFISTANVINSTEKQVDSISKFVDAIIGNLKPIENALQTFRMDYIKLSEESEALKKLSANQDTILDLLDLPQLIKSCVSSNLFDEALNVMTFSKQTLYTLRVRYGESCSLLDELQSEIKKQETRLNESLLLQLKGESSLPVCVKTIGYLRRLGIIDEEDLRKEFLLKRNDLVFLQRKQLEALSTTNCTQGLRSAADLLRTHVCDSAIYYKTIFSEFDSNIFSWVTEHIEWFIAFLKRSMLPPYFHDKSIYSFTPNNIGSFGSFFQPPPLSASSLSALYRQVQHTSLAFKKFHAHFFNAVSPIFDLYMQLYISNLLDGCLLHFQQELGKYSWVASGKIEEKNISEESNASTITRDVAMQLTRHPPLAMFANDLLQIINEIRQCALLSLRHVIRSRFEECLYGSVGVINALSLELLDGVSSSEIPHSVYTFNSSVMNAVKNQKKEEYRLFCKNFAEILVPLVSQTYQSIYGESDALNSEAFISHVKSIGLA